VGLIVEFYAGDARAIAAALADEEHDGDLSSLVRAEADLSLHIPLEGLDPLFAMVTGGAISTLAEACVKHLAGPADPMEATYAAELISSALVRAFARVADTDIAPLAGRWMRANDAEPTDDGTNAVAELVKLCRLADTERIPVLLYWSL
jgi:hypothetical protein